MVRLVSSVRFRQGARQNRQPGGVAQLAEHSAHNRGVGGSSPPAATKQPTAAVRRPDCPRRGQPPRGSTGSEAAVAKGEKRVKITLACEQCKRRNYITTKNKQNDRERLELKKYCRWDRTHTLHRETR